MPKKPVVMKRCIASLCCCVALLVATVAFGAGAIRVPDGNVTLENGYLDLSPTGKGVIFPDGTVQTTKATGVPGPPGAAGTNGVDGKTLLSGTSDPAAGTGANGDFYINTASNKIFGPKAGGIWPAGVSLVGATGPAGANYTSPKAPVLATGQQTTYAEGDDGNWKSGAVVSGSRFTDNLVNGVSNGTVTDNLTGLIWLKNANCSATLGGVANTGTGLTWANALTWSNNLASGSCGLTDGSIAGQWRLPNRKELMSLGDLSKYNPALPTGHPFISVQSYLYWSSSSYSSDTTNAWVVYMVGGNVVSYDKSSNFYVWPVRAGQ